jgi:competence protein ComEC
MFAACLDRERARWFNWAPVLVAAGTSVYFAMQNEPSWPLVILVAAATCACLWRYLLVRTPFSGAVAFVGIGFLAAVIRTATVATPDLTDFRFPVTVTGWIETVEVRENGSRRLTVRPVTVGKGDATGLPPRIRVVDRHRTVLAPGTLVTVRARLYPPPGPAMPGGHDFARDAWYRGIGAVGYTLSIPVPRVGDMPMPAPVRVRAAIEIVRTGITETIRGIAPGPPGDLIAALVTGQRSSLPQEAVDAMRASGLAHLLAISGLHMTLVAGAMFQILRGTFALFPLLALGFPIKKWAAIGALVGAAGYLVVSGAAVSTQRAFIMMAVMFLAILLDRQALTMRNVAIAALVVMLSAPENVFHAGFQMSFATVVGLVAFYEWAARLRTMRSRRPGPVGRLLRGTIAVGATTLVASIATAPIAAFHFHQRAAFSLAANLVAVPLVGFVVMPCALIGVLLLPFDLGGPFLAVSAAAGDLVLGVADKVSSLSGAVVHVPATTTAPVITMIAGGMWLCLWSGRWRLFGLAPIILASTGIGTAPRPDILVDRDGRNLAVRNVDARLVVMSVRRSAFAVEAWLTADGDGATQAEAAARPGLVCDPLGCAGRTGSGLRLAYVRNPAVLLEECVTADILVTPLRIDRRRCRGPTIVLTGAELDGMAYSITDGLHGPVAVNSNDGRGDRPWSRRPRINGQARDDTSRSRSLP